MTAQATDISDLIGWIFLFCMFFGGGIYAGWDRLMDAIGQRPRKGLTAKQARQLTKERDDALGVLREIQAYDKYAAYPLTQELSEKVNAVLKTPGTPQIEGKKDA